MGMGNGKNGRILRALDTGSGLRPDDDADNECISIVTIQFISPNKGLTHCLFSMRVPFTSTRNLLYCPLTIPLFRCSSYCHWSVPKLLVIFLYTKPHFFLSLPNTKRHSTSKLGMAFRTSRCCDPGIASITWTCKGPTLDSSTALCFLPS